VDIDLLKVYEALLRCLRRPHA